MRATGRLVTAPPRAAVPDDARWRRRHRLVAAFLALHLPLVATVVVVSGQRPADALPAAALAGSLLAVGIAVRRRRVASLAVTAGLVTTSAALVAATGGAPEARLHFFFVAAVLVLYHDWLLYLIAAVLAVAGAWSWDAAGPGWGPSVDGLSADPWLWAVVQAAFVVFVAALREAAREAGSSAPGGGGVRDAGTGPAAAARRARRDPAEDEARDRVLALASHELRTPLTAIIGLTRTLVVHHDELDRPRLARCLEGLEEHAARLSRLVDNLVAAAEAERGGDGEVELAPVVAAAVAEVGDAALRFDVDVPSGLRVALDAPTTRLVVTNLIDNARKFAFPGTRVTVTARPVGDRLELMVGNVVRSDDEAAVHRLGDRLFEPFVQGDSSDTRTAQGLGLGLHVVRKVAGTHGGSIDLRAEEGRLTAAVSLPTAASPGPRAGQPEVVHL